MISQNKVYPLPCERVDVRGEMFRVADTHEVSEVVGKLSSALASLLNVAWINIL